jgi:hypothetical protein
VAGIPLRSHGSPTDVFRLPGRPPAVGRAAMHPKSAAAGSGQLGAGQMAWRGDQCTGGRPKCPDRGDSGRYEAGAAGSRRGRGNAAFGVAPA